MLITKADGEQEPFDPRKLDESLIRAGVQKDTRMKIIAHIQEEITDGMGTSEIYRHAFSLLEKEKKPLAARYSIKRAILDLGPSGFPFEQFIAALWSAHGYTNVHTGVALTGACATHEVDVLATKNGRRIAAELKFHNSVGVKTDLKVGLYVFARFQDLQNTTTGEHIDEGWLVTNTKFTHNVTAYASCAGLKMLGWNYPRGEGIEALIESASIHPLTSLTTLKNHEKRQMLDDNMVLCRSIDDKDILKRYGVTKDRITDILEEIKQLCTEKVDIRH